MWLLLIVPEGIEISMTKRKGCTKYTFNRTRRNWNDIYVINRENVAWSFNRTRRNWNKINSSKVGTIHKTFNRTRRNWNGLKYLQLDDKSIAFNRTRRNWNKFIFRVIFRVVSFNRTRRNWNLSLDERQSLAKILLIVPEGIEIV